MVKDFDALLSEERTFKLGGEVFTVRNVRPEVLTLFDFPAPGANGKSEADMKPAELKKLRQAQATYTWDLADAQILMFIVPEDHERYRTLRQREENAVTIKQIEALIGWLWEEQTGRPLEQPSP